MKRIFVGLCLLFAMNLAWADCRGPACRSHPKGCQHANALGIACVKSITTDGHYAGSFSGGVTFPKGLPAQGTTLASVEAQFPIVILWEFEHLTAAQLNAQFAKLATGDKGTSTTYLQVARFSHLLYVETHGGAQFQEINAIAAQKLTAANLAIWNRAFDADTATPIKYSHAAHMQAGLTAFTSNGYPVTSAGNGKKVIDGVSPGGGGIAAPNTYMTLYEVYTEYLFTEAASIEGAVALAAAYAGGELLIAWNFGYTVGGLVNTIGESIDPSFSADLWSFWADPHEYVLDPESEPDSGVSITFGEPTTIWPDGTIGGGSWDEIGDDLPD